MSYRDEGESPLLLACFFRLVGVVVAWRIGLYARSRLMLFSFSFIIITKSCRYFFLAGDTGNLPRAVPRSLGHPPWHGDAHAGDERLLAVA
jgi:hypothetical protein